MLFNKEKKYLDAPVSDAANFLKQTKTFMELPENIIMCPVGGLTKTVQNNYKTKYTKLGLEGDVYTFEKHNCAFVTNFGMGAPAFAMMMEVLTGLGAKNFVLTGYAGSLQKYLKVGDIVVCSEALRDEGVSSSYIAPAGSAYPDAALTNKIKTDFEKNNLPYKYGPTWTTDVLFRETAAEIKHYQAGGVQTVEMEAAAAFAVAQHYKTKCAALFVISDQLANLKWEPAFGHQDIHASMQHILKTIINIFN
ncbi:MAG: nucleoside phosphorylase [Elusimicrobium sp.]|jgi:uridine phosphorylase|nr:nucleoside phosphorylase [Elusimicrobium sp.]